MSTDHIGFDASDPQQVANLVKASGALFVRELASEIGTSEGLALALLNHLERNGHVKVSVMKRVTPGSPYRPLHRPNATQWAVLSQVATWEHCDALELERTLDGIDEVQARDIADELVAHGFLTRSAQGRYAPARPSALRPATTPHSTDNSTGPANHQVSPTTSATDRRFVGDADVGGRPLSRVFDAAVYWIAGVAAFFIASSIGGFLPVALGIGALIYGSVIFFGQGPYWQSSIVYAVAAFAVIGAFGALT